MRQQNNWSDVRFCIVSRKQVNKRCTFFHFGIKYFLRWRIAQGYLLHLRSSFQLLCAYLLNHFSRFWLQFQESRVRSLSGSKPYGGWPWNHLLGHSASSSVSKKVVSYMRTYVHEGLVNHLLMVNLAQEKVRLDELTISHDHGCWLRRKESKQTKKQLFAATGCQQPPKTHENGCKDRDLLCVGALLEAWHVMFYTRWKHTVVCMMILLTDKAAQVINQWEIV